MYFGTSLFFELKSGKKNTHSRENGVGNEPMNQKLLIPMRL